MHTPFIFLGAVLMELKDLKLEERYRFKKNEYYRGNFLLPNGDCRLVTKISDGNCEEATLSVRDVRNPKQNSLYAFPDNNIFLEVRSFEEGRFVTLSSKKMEIYNFNATLQPQLQSDCTKNQLSIRI